MSHKVTNTTRGPLVVHTKEGSKVVPVKGSLIAEFSDAEIKSLERSGAEIEAVKSDKKTELPQLPKA